MTLAQVSVELTTLVNFNAITGPGGFSPSGSLTLGSDGNFYGTTLGGGTGNAGTVFRLTPAGTFVIIYNFTGSADGEVPSGGLVQGGDGNFYGTTLGSNDLPYGSPSPGTVFKITPAGVFTTLYNFSSGDGAAPNGPLALGSDGNFYGTADDGTVFVITSAGVLTTLCTFPASETPNGGVILGSDGNFYGTTFGENGGTLFRVTPQGVLTTLFPFNLNQSEVPNGGLVQGSDGSFYGTTRNTVFHFIPPDGVATLYTFGGPDGLNVSPGLVQGSDGNFYGTTEQGGATYRSAMVTGEGTVFQITPKGVLTTLYSFASDEGGFPIGTLTPTGDGRFFGATQMGPTVDTASSAGTIFALTVTPQPAFFTGETSLGENVYYLQFSNGDFFGYYLFLSDPSYLYHFGLGYEYVFDAKDGQDGVYLYDFASSDFFYTSPTFPFPYLYDFDLKSVLYYYPAANAGHYTSNPRIFYDFATGQIITK